MVFVGRAVLAVSLVVTPCRAPAQELGVADASHATEEVAAFFGSFFTAKSNHDVAATMEHFSPDVVTYTDATLGWPFDGFDAIEGVFTEYMPTWPEAGLSYPTRIIGGTGSAVVAFTDTPELFGGELRILGAVDFQDGMIVRWVDYWDGRTFDPELYEEMRTPDEAFPTDFKERALAGSASPVLRSIATGLQAAFAAGDARSAAAFFNYDAVYEDMTLRAQVLGRAQIEQYLARILPKAPFGEGARLRHVVGNELGGGFEWIGSSMTAVKSGITVLELDANGKISRLTSVYDGRELLDIELEELVLLSVDR